VEKNEDRLTESAFLKTNTQLLFLKIEGTKNIANKIQKNQKIKVKFEVDVDPATSFQTEIKTQLLPSPFTIQVLTPPSLFSGKMHAALLRKWKGRVKGRDFYDIQWYIARGIPLKKTYLEEKMRNSGALNVPLTKELIVDLFRKRVDMIDWNQATQDVLPFLKDKNQIKLWSPPFFKELISKIKIMDEP